MKKLIVFALLASSFFMTGCVTKSGDVSDTLINDDFSTFDQNVWAISKGNISVNNGTLTIDSEGCTAGYIKHSLATSEWQVVELRAKVEKVYGDFVGDIVGDPASIYYNKMGIFCIWDENGQRPFTTGDNEWHTWKIVQTDKGLDIYMDGVYQITSILNKPKYITLGCQNVDQDHGVRVSYDWIKVK